MAKHVIVWIDHQQARIFHIGAEKMHESTVDAASQPAHHKHEKGAAAPRNHPDDAKRFFHATSIALAGVDEVLLVGPSTAKLDFIRYLHQHDRALETKMVGVETVDHPTDGQLVAYGKEYFKLSTQEW